jgi:DNA-binding IclR family transcriptional regulator
MAMKHGLTTSKGDVLQSVVRALGVLEVLALNPNGVTPKTVSTKLSLNLSTTYHLLNTLLVCGYAIRSPETQLFQLGPRVASLHGGLLDALRVAPRLLPFVHALRQATGATAMLGQWENDEVIVSAVVDSDEEVRDLGRYVGFAGATHAIAMGKVLLAWASPEQSEAYVARTGLRRYTPGTTTDPDRLRAELQQIRRVGYALDKEDFLPGHCCVSAPVFSADGSVRESLAATLPPSRFELEESALVAATLDIARAASYAMGADPARYTGQVPSAGPLTQTRRDSQ